jgi:hypothetical protein
MSALCQQQIFRGDVWNAIIYFHRAPAGCSISTQRPIERASEFAVRAADERDEDDVRAM